MKIIKDKNLIEHRVALQEVLVNKSADFVDYLKRFRILMLENAITEKEAKQSLENKVQSIALPYFELQYGNFFYKQNAQFRNSVITLISQRYIKEIRTTKIDNIEGYALNTIYIYLEQALKEEINKANNGS